MTDLGIRLRGPVEVERDGESARVRGDVPRSILVRLAWSPRELVATEQLAADVWEEVPDAAAGTLRAHVSRLRSSGLGAALVGVRGGYILDVDRGAVDATRLIDSAAEIGGPRADEDHLARLVDLADLADGTVAAGVARSPFVAAARRQWDSARREVEENLAETALVLGDPALACAVLEGTVARHPGTERPVRLLATALARSTRYADAVDVIDRFAADAAARGLEASSRLAGLRLSITRLEPSVVATPAAATVHRVGIPIPLTHFVGREGTLAALRRARGEHRLITIVGPAGVGKTRTAVQLAREATSEIDDEQYMVDLADVRSPDAVVRAIAATVRAAEPTVEAIVRRVSGSRALLLLDNADHVLGALAVAASALVSQTSGLRVLVTSREPLRLPEEHEVVLRPFAREETEDAWRLFSERAADARGGEQFDEREEQEARALCDELDGIPLALELAAARLDVLDAASLRSGLSAWAEDGRHGSVQSAIAWSFDLLDPQLQRTLVRAGRFAGPFTPEAFAGAEGIDEDEARRALDALVGKSLLAPVRGDGGRRRLRILESTREFVAGKDDGSESVEWRRRHREWFADLVWDLGPTLRAAQARDTMAVFDGFGADIDAALDSAVDAGDRASALMLVAGLAQYWHLRGRFREGRERIDAALALDDAADDERAAAALPVAELELANLAYQLGDAQAGFVAIAGAQAHGQAVGDASTTAVALARAGYGQSLFGDLDTARSLIRAASQIASDSAAWARSEVRLCEGQMLRHVGEPDAAIEALVASHELAMSVGYTWMVTSSQYLLAKALLDARRPREAIAIARDGVRWARANEDAAAGLALLHAAAGACAVVERHELGARLFGAVDALGVRYGYSPETAEGEDATRLRAAVAAGLGPGEFDREYRNGRGLDWGDALEIVDRLPRTPFVAPPADKDAITSP